LLILAYPMSKELVSKVFEEQATHLGVVKIFLKKKWVFYPFSFYRTISILWWIFFWLWIWLLCHDYY